LPLLFDIMPDDPSKINKKHKTYEINKIREIEEIYHSIKRDIEDRLDEFETVWNEASGSRLFEELAFCLFTPQSKAENCWMTIERLKEKGLLFEGGAETVAEEMRYVRFRNNKARYLLEARGLFVRGAEARAGDTQLWQKLSEAKGSTLAVSGIEARGADGGGEINIRARLSRFDSPYKMRSWLAANVKGLGMKEASHFLRNIGLGQKLAILDRHILRNLVEMGALDELPKSISEKRYLHIESILLELADDIDIPPDHLDLLLWYKEAGEIFK